MKRMRTEIDQKKRIIVYFSCQERENKGNKQK
jgi:hypothetical protein